MERLFEKLRRLRLRTLNRGGAGPSDLPLENTDAWAAAVGGIQHGGGYGGHNSIPPNYVKAYDEGRPRH